MSSPWGRYGAPVTPTEPDHPAAPDGPVDAPATLLWAVRLLLIEAVGLAVVTAYLGYQDLTGAPTRLGVAIALTVSAGLGALAVAAVARALGRHSTGARGPAVVIQMMLLVAAYYMLRAGLLWLGVPLILLGLATGVLIVAPPTTRALGLD
jgi:hypothetical protein